MWDRTRERRTRKKNWLHPDWDRSSGPLEWPWSALPFARAWQRHVWTARKGQQHGWRGLQRRNLHNLLQRRSPHNLWRWLDRHSHTGRGAEKSGFAPTLGLRRRAWREAGSMGKTNALGEKGERSAWEKRGEQNRENKKNMYYDHFNYLSIVWSYFTKWFIQTILTLPVKLLIQLKLIKIDSTVKLCYAWQALILYVY